MPRFRAPLPAVAIFSAAAFFSIASCAESYPRLAPYQAIRWSAEQPEASIDGAWRPLISIDGVATSEIVAFCQETYGVRWKKRFEEDLVEAMTRMGHRPGGAVTLVVERPGGTGRETLKGVKMTHANRQAIWQARRGSVRTPRPHGPSQTAPYDAIRWQSEEPEVRIQGDWFKLCSIDGLEASAMVQHCKTTYTRIWRKRFEEDLKAVMLGMGKPPGATVTLVVQGLDAEATETLRDVPMTKENRKSIWLANHQHRVGGGTAADESASSRE